MGVCYCCLNNSFQYLNNIIRIFTHFFTQIYFYKITTMLLKISYQQSKYRCTFILMIQLFTNNQSIVVHSFSLYNSFFDYWLAIISIIDSLKKIRHGVRSALGICLGKTSPQ